MNNPCRTQEYLFFSVSVTLFGFDFKQDEVNPRLQCLQPYPFEKMASLLEGIVPPADKAAIALSIGEPCHAAPKLAFEAMTASLSRLAHYPATRGDITLRETIANWLNQRFGLTDQPIDPQSQVLPVNGTREALFAIAQCVIDPSNNAKVLTANPFYQIYEGAALLAGAKPVYLNPAPGKLIPDFECISDALWQDCQLLYICSPNNPTGSCIDLATLQKLIEKAQRFNFVIASDECYSEIYFDEDCPPPGLLQAAQAIGLKNFRNCLVFHSLSKRSNLPGLRSGFVAGDGEIMKAFFQYRTYHGCAMPPVTQATSIAAWQDEEHVKANRQLYREKFSAVLNILKPVMSVSLPDAGFYLWPELALEANMDDKLFAQRLYREENIKVVPGSYLSREVNGCNPGHNRIRMALVAKQQECTEAAKRIRNFIVKLQQEGLWKN
ncbi:MAG: succinyldiaminopimelate transaminase [Gammaproteobacteria bacterium]|nr:MAG: succinyldiaminopimelate transaminase [Gammaproteobacteria bacterium]